MGKGLDELLEGKDAEAAAAAAAVAAEGRDEAAAAAAVAAEGGDEAAAAAAVAGNKEINIESINRAFGSEYSSIDDIKNALSQVSEVDSLRAREKDHIALIEREYDVMGMFADEKSFKLNEIRKQNPSISPFVVNQLLEINNIEEMDGMQALVLKRVMDTPSYQRNINEVESLINYEYGLDVDVDRIEDENDKARAESKIRLGKLKMEGDAENAKKEFTSLLNVQIPEKKDVNALLTERNNNRDGKIEKLKKDFTPIAEGLMKNFSKVELKYPDGNIAIDFSVSDKDKDFLYKGMLDAAVKNGLNPGNKDDVTKLNNYARNFIVANNLSKILKAHEENIVSRMRNNEYDLHNVAKPGDLDKGVSGGGQHAETNDEIIMREAKKKN